MVAISGGSGVSHGWGRCSASSWSIRHGHLPALITVTNLSPVTVPQLCAGRRWRFRSPHRLKVFRITLKPGTFPTRSGSILFWIGFIVKTVSSANRFIKCFYLRLACILQLPDAIWQLLNRTKKTSDTNLSKLLDCTVDVGGYRVRSLGLKSLKRFCCRLL